MRVCRPRFSAVFFTITILASLIFLLDFTVFGATTNVPKRLTNAKPGDCGTCHAGGKSVLPENHPKTRAMTLGMCMECHVKDEVPLTNKMPTSHTHMLSGISCLKCHGKKIPFTKLDMNTCINCHSTEALAKAEARGHTLPNPHNSHYGTELECSLCHHQHAKSEFYCAQCHNFGNVTPSPITQLTFPGKPEVTGKAPVPEKPGRPKITGPPLTCRTCHYEPPYNELFLSSPHGAQRCNTCHKDVKDYTKHMEGKEAAGTISCLNCHQEIQKQGFHGTVKNFSCLQCHSGIHPKEAATAKKSRVTPPLTGDCRSCHSGPAYTKYFDQTSHRVLSCTACHPGIRDINAHVLQKEKPALISCTVCHRDVEKIYSKSFHAVGAKVSCLQCHTDIHPINAVSGRNDKAAALHTCINCHNDREKYVNKGHTAKFLAGNKDAAVCSDCHGIHDTPVFAATAAGNIEKKVYYTKSCFSCHREGGTANRHGVFAKAVKTYGETYHGKVWQLGDPDKVAGCADCHTGHNILPALDPASALSPQELVKTCGKCHHGFHPRFVSYVTHPDPDNPKKFLGLYLTRVFMIALLAGVFGFFWIHVLLWWRKAYAEKRRLIREGLQVKVELSEEEWHLYVRRFSMQERIMHVVLILSFFGLILSGFPLKYPTSSWTRLLITIFGSVENAGHIHRISAAVMWALFLYTCWLSLKFLFPKFQVRGWVDRLFGPDSLFPRIKDFQDCWGMFKWFFNRGEKPQFDRWTYWEKFDFMAVFWGMFVIGLSGLVMWLPELSSYIMPGWMINIAHLAHSEEALLAAVFIFTIHFFNNHLVPDKFPLERNIFTGSYTLEALRRERPLEYERILRENRLEEIKCKGPGTATTLYAKLFGLASVLLGLLLTILIFWAAFTT